MIELKLKSGATFSAKSLAIKGTIADSNGSPIGGKSEFVFIESELDALEAALAKMGLSFQAIYDAVFGASEPEESNEE